MKNTHMKYGGRRTKYGEIFSRLTSCIALLFLIALISISPSSVLRPSNAFAQTRTLSDSLPTTNVNSTETKGRGAFKLIVCDGPVLPAGVDKPNGYIPCDFNGVMLQVQHLINIMMVLGVMAAIVGMSYVGFLYIRGREKDRSEGKVIFEKLFWGFIIMLTAWFIVFQILSWLTEESGFTSLLGK